MVSTRKDDIIEARLDGKNVKILIKGDYRDNEYYIGIKFDCTTKDEVIIDMQSEIYRDKESITDRSTHQVLDLSKIEDKDLDLLKYISKSIISSIYQTYPVGDSLIEEDSNKIYNLVLDKAKEYNKYFHFKKSKLVVSHLNGINWKSI